MTETSIYIYKKYFFILVLAIPLMAQGCGHKPAPFLPLDAVKTRIPVQNLEDQKGQASLQVLIMYSATHCSHAALRLYYPHKGAIFWDPAGGYGLEGTASAKRENDLILEGAPTINDYIRFRTEIPTRMLEIFEWSIALDIAENLYTILSNGTDKSHPRGRFSTKGTGLFCGAHISDFLNRFALDLFHVEKVFFPHDLSKQLYKKKPDRIIIVDVWKTMDIKEIHQKTDAMLNTDGQ